LLGDGCGDGCCLILSPLKCDVLGEAELFLTQINSAIARFDIWRTTEDLMILILKSPLRHTVVGLMLTTSSLAASPAEQRGKTFA
jgi:hypothetical protein